MILNADCRTLPEDAEFDVLITDPPYSEHVHKSAVSQSAARGVRHRDMGFHYLTRELRTYTASLASRAKRWSVIFSDVEGLGAWYEELATYQVEYIRTIPWVRWSMPQLSGDRPPTGCEMVIVAHRQHVGGKRPKPMKKSWNGPGNLTHFAHKCLRGEGKHRAEKPLDLALDLVEWFSDTGDLVLDPFAGAGTISLAARLLERKTVGFELDEAWASKANLRLTGPLSDRDKDRVQRWTTSREQAA